MRFSRITGTLSVLLVWVLVTETGVIQRVFLPSPLAVFAEVFRLCYQGEIFSDLLASVWRTVVGFLLGCTLGVVIGLVMGGYRTVHDAMEFPVDFFRSVPATALFPLFIVIWGLGDQVKVFIAAWASAMVVLINTIYGMRNVKTIRIMVARTKRIAPWKVFYKVMIPDALPYVIAGARIGLSLALVVEIVAEMFLGGHSGLGYRIFNATSVFQMEEAYATVVVVGAIGYAGNKLIMSIERRFVHWSGR